MRFSQPLVWTVYDGVLFLDGILDYAGAFCQYSEARCMRRVWAVDEFRDLSGRRYLGWHHHKEVFDGKTQNKLLVQAARDEMVDR